MDNKYCILSSNMIWLTFSVLDFLSLSYCLTVVNPKYVFKKKRLKKPSFTSLISLLLVRSGTHDVHQDKSIIVYK